MAQAHDIGHQKRQRAQGKTKRKAKKAPATWRNWCRHKDHPPTCSCEYE